MVSSELIMIKRCKEINLRVLICLITFGWFINLGYGAELDTTTKEEEWREADQKWSAFANEHMERMKNYDLTLPRAKLPNYKFDMEWIEVKSKLITKYLTDYRIFADRRFMFVLDKKGHIICLGETWPLKRPFETAPDFEVKKLSEFFRNLRIQVKDEGSAIDLIKLSEIIQGNGYTDDKELERRDRSWAYKVSKKDKKWYVTMRYIGPPAQIMEPPVWKIQLEQYDYLQTIKELYLGSCDVNGDGDCDLSDVKNLEELMGECIPGSTKFNVIADMDHDDCITNKDRDFLLQELSKQE